MIDAYTIGITLALEDGVSEGIVAIRRDLAALDAAVADSAARLLMLRKLAAGLAVPKPTAEITQTAALFAPAAGRPQPVAAPVATTTEVTKFVAGCGFRRSRPVIPERSRPCIPT
jgi:hypothetical protein